MTSVNFESNSFALQVISKGSFVDAEGDISFLVEATTVRLNHVALNAWLLSEMMNVRECYADGAEGDVEWEAHKAEYAERRRVWKEQVIKSLDVDPRAGSVSITQSQSEVFTVVHIRKVA